MESSRTTCKETDHRTVSAGDDDNIVVDFGGHLPYLSRSACAAKAADGARSCHSQTIRTDALGGT
ncbi:hypothetical protein D0Z07_6158 [Hyphodiscus hymeniophilus]|uniref:Uncharacterized protein n=1 Tax=Hyphodiscus hymeniophilus TaxID=353542 RepID=A0A9P6VF73_9HELO|nr:hypothetical protein D0Z07_6158 [Hyphodiscus hymeniophilus]